MFKSTWLHGIRSQEPCHSVSLISYFGERIPFQTSPWALDFLLCNVKRGIAISDSRQVPFSSDAVADSWLRLNLGETRTQRRARLKIQVTIIRPWSGSSTGSQISHAALPPDPPRLRPLPLPSYILNRTSTELSRRVTSCIKQLRLRLSARRAIIDAIISHFLSATPPFQSEAKSLQAQVQNKDLTIGPSPPCHVVARP